jgi:chemotaxis protein histidine kinase CheA
MNELEKKLTEYGADVTGAKERFMGDEELYRQCIEMFRADESFDNLKKAIDAKDYKAAFEYAHTLKGVAGNLGLTPMFGVICAIVEPLRAGDYSDLDGEYDAVDRERKRFFSMF